MVVKRIIIIVIVPFMLGNWLSWVDIKNGFVYSTTETRVLNSWDVIMRASNYSNLKMDKRKRKQLDDEILVCIMPQEIISTTRFRCCTKHRFDTPVFSFSDLKFL